MTIETGVTYKINLSRKKTLIERRVGIKAQGAPVESPDRGLQCRIPRGKHMAERKARSTS